MSIELQVMVRARQMVADGWIQGSAYNFSHSRRCAGAALNDAYIEVVGVAPEGGPCMCPSCGHRRGSDHFSEVVRVFTDVIGCESIPAWNDAHGRTQEEVLRAFDRAIARVFEREPKVTVAETPVVKVEYKPIEKIIIDPPQGPFESAIKKVLAGIGV